MIYKSTFGWSPPSAATELPRPNRPFWPEPERVVAGQLLKVLRDTFTGSGWEWSIDFELRIHGLVGLGTRDPDPPHHVIDTGLLMDIVPHLPAESSNLLELAEALLAQRIADRARDSRARTKSCVLLIPVDLRIDWSLDTTSRTIVFGGSRIVLMSSDNDLGSIAETLAAPWLSTSKADAHGMPTCAAICSRGDSFQNAWKAVEPTWEAFRGWMEWALHGFGVGMSLGSIRSRSRVPPPLRCISKWDDGSSDDSELTNTVPHVRAMESLQTLHPKNLERLAQPIAESTPARRSTMALFHDCLRLYALAMDHPTDHGCLLHLWQIAENITAPSERRGETAEIARRLHRVLFDTKMEERGRQEFLRLIGDHRNDIVHRGLHDFVTQNEVGLFQVMIQMTFRWLLNIATKLPTQQHLTEYMAACGRPMATREVQSDVLRFLAEKPRRQ